MTQINLSTLLKKLSVMIRCDEFFLNGRNENKFAGNVGTFHFPMESDFFLKAKSLLICKYFT